MGLLRVQHAKPESAAPDNSSTSTLANGVGILLLCAFGFAVSNSGIFAALSDLQDKYGFSDAGLGFISATGFLAQVVVALVIAPYADRGHPKRLVLIGLVISAIGSMLYVFGGSLTAFVIARGLTGASGGCASPALRALIANIDKSRAAERLGMLRGVELAGFTGGPLIGAVLITPFGPNNAFIFFAAFAVVAFVVVIPRHLPTLPTTAESKRLSIELLRLRPIRAAALASLILFLPIGVYDSLWDRYVTDRGGNNFTVGVSFLLYTIPFVALGARGGRLSDTHGSRRIAIIGILMACPVVATYGLLTNPWLVVSFGIVEGIVGALAIPAAQSMMTRAAPEGRASAAQGLSGAGDLLGGAIVALFAPAIYGSLGPAATFSVVAGVMFLLLLVTIHQSRPDEPAREAKPIS